MWSIKAGSYILDKFNKDVKNEFDRSKGSLIYSSAGAVKAFFNDCDAAEQFAKCIAKKLKSETEIAALNWAVSEIKNSNFASAIDEVEKMIQEKRNKKTEQVSMVNNPLFADCEICKKYPACEMADIPQKAGAILCRSCYLKQEVRKEKLGIYNKINNTLDLPDDLESLVGDDYLALICSDGNRLGEILIELSKQNKPELLSKFSESLEKATIEAFKESVEAVFRDLAGYRNFPFLVVVLGGDDMTMAMPSKYAFKFVKKFSEKFYEKTSEFTDNLPKVSVSTGIAIAKRNYPFSNLYHIAEELQKNAKKLSRYLKTIQPGDEHSTVDFEIITESLTENIGERRKTIDFGTYIVTGKPYSIGSSDYVFKFEDLIGTVDKLKEKKVSNSFINSLYEVVSKPDTAAIELKRRMKKHSQKLSETKFESFIEIKGNFEKKQSLPLLDLAEIFTLQGGK